ncbi:unnamed protein product [Cuscuta europaea]|uniref:Protein SHORT-ROOT-like n=1 Tax=Cuscuta europaea TaxID=41803 RepID=A0A9P0ZWA1_CUSEU|nr:unnamed protein product [Cuscuta europaea]
MILIGGMHNQVIDYNMQRNCALSPSTAAAAADILTTTANNDGNWAERLIKECAVAISLKDSAKIHHLLWMLNELASPYGDSSQKLAAHFLKALFCKATETGPRVYKTLVSISEKSHHSFDSARNLILKFQEVSPWTTFGHVASNGAILDALLDGAGDVMGNKLHIIDISNTFCTQWPTLLEALATRSDETPHLKLTIVSMKATMASSLVMSELITKEISQRMEKFARLMGVPFELNFVSEVRHLGEITKEMLNVQDGESLAINCIGALRRVAVGERAGFLNTIRSLNPKIVTIVEEEADTSGGDYVKCLEECLRFYTLYFNMLEESFPTTSNQRLMLERECSRSIVRVLGCDDENQAAQLMKDDDDYYYGEKRERGGRWCDRFREAGFSPFDLNDDTVDDVNALLKRYKGGWAHHRAPQGVGVNSNSSSSSSGIFLTWKDEPVVWASAWKP